MNREEFGDIIDDIVGKVYYPVKRKNGHQKSTNPFYGPCLKLKSKWVTGGEQGGSCWDDGESDHHYSVEAHPEPDLEYLDEILSAVAPQTSFIQYRELEKLITRNSETDNEYYGNYTTYGTKELKIEDLWDFLCAQKLV